jgi:hypothetical protein
MEMNYCADNAFLAGCEQGRLVAEAQKFDRENMYFLC